MVRNIAIFSMTKVVSLFTSCLFLCCQTNDCSEYEYGIEILGYHDIVVDGHFVVGDSLTIFNNFELGDSILYLNDELLYHYTNNNHHLRFKKIEKDLFAASHMYFNEKNDKGVYIFNKELSYISKKGFKNIFPCAYNLYKERDKNSNPNEGDIIWALGGNYLTLSPFILFVDGELDAIFLYQ